MDTIIPFETQAAVTVQEVGGKALSLIHMTRAGLPVPPGFVLASGFFTPWLDALAGSPEWRAVQDGLNGGPGGAEALHNATRALAALCGGLVFAPSMRQALANGVTGLRAPQPFRGVQPGGVSEPLFAVRSSSPEEDLESASFAGGYETTLGVTLDQLESAVRRSFASSFDERVFLYKKEHGFSTALPRIAVVVQQQVDADSAGVAFSVNPLNNCYDEALINANLGLGETVVSGAVDPDSYVVDRLASKITETRTGGKGMVALLNPGGGITYAQRTGETGASLSPGQVLQIAVLLDQVEAVYEKPVDIEWAYSGERLFLLQARPITTYLPLPEVMRTARGEPKKLYANSTLIEQGLSEPLSVLGTDFLGYVLAQVGGPVAKDSIGPDGITFTAGGGYYMNISYALKLGMRSAALAPGSFGDPRVMAILDSIDMREYTAITLPEKLKAARRKMLANMLPMVRSIIEAYFRPESVLRRYQAALPEELRRLNAFSGAGLSLKEQAVRLTGLLDFFYGQYGIPMILAGQIAQQRIRGLFKHEAAQVQDHLNQLGIALPGNKTTEMGELMYALAASPEVERFVSPADFLAELEGGRLSPEFTRTWREFLQAFGMRAPAEIDPATPRPYEDPGRFFEQLKQLSRAVRERGDGASFFEEARAKRDAAYQALAAVARKQGKSRAKALERSYRRWETFGGYRETPKHYVIQVVDIFRRQALEIGRRLAAEGRLERPEQVFDLTIDDIDQGMADPTLDLRALARERSALIEKIRRSHLVARVIDSRGKIFAPPRRPAADGELAGVPISPGVARGRVKVLRHAAEKPLLPGEILVTRATDPGWTPLFINAGGIILEIGGALQHGAVVAREYGIPCVSGLDDATTRLRDGQLVEVDGSNGLVRIIDTANAEQ